MPAESLTFYLSSPPTKTLRRIGVRQSADIIRIFYLFYVFHHLLIRIIFSNNKAAHDDIIPYHLNNPYIHICNMAVRHEN